MAPIPAFSHVVLVAMENHGFGQIIGATTGAPYINNTLVPGGALFTGYHAPGHPSFPNYFVLVSGLTWGSAQFQTGGDKCPPTGFPFSGANLGSLLLGKGLTFKNYVENLPANHQAGDSAPYYGHHNPIPFFSNVPAANTVSFSTFPTTAAGYAALPTVSLVIPNGNNDMHDGTVTQGDTWLSANMDGYAQWAKLNNSLLIVWWDEDYGAADNPPQIFYGANITPGRYAEPLSHVNFLRTLCDMYGLAAPGGAAAATPVTSIWSTGGTPPPPLALTIGTTSIPPATAGVFYTTTLAASGGALPYTWSVAGSGGGGGGGGGGGTNFADNPSAFGYPDATNTGAILGALTNLSGPTSGTGWSWDGSALTVSGSGVTVANLNVPGQVFINGSNVTLRNCYVTANAFNGNGITVGGAGYLIDHCTVQGVNDTNSGLDAGIKGQGGNNVSGTIDSCHIFNSRSGIQDVAGTVQNTYIHQLRHASGDHINGLTRNGGTEPLVIRHNTIFCEFGQTDAVGIFPDFGSEGGETVTDNILSGGGYTIYGGAGTAGGDPVNVKITLNRISDNVFPQGGQFGWITANGSSGRGNILSGNLWDATGQVIPGQDPGPPPTGGGGGSSPLPAGITLAASTGVLSGTAANAGSYPFTAQVADHSSPAQTDTQALTLTVSTTPPPPGLAVTTPALPTAQAGTAYRMQLAASGGTAPYTWTETGALPAGFTLTAAGLLSGTTSVAGTFPLAFRVADSAGHTATAQLSLVVGTAPPPPPPPPPGNPVVMGGGVSAALVPADVHSATMVDTFGFITAADA